MLAAALESSLSDHRMRIFFVESETLGQRGDMGGAHLAAASDRRGPGRYPVLSERRVGRWTEVMPLAQKVGRRSDVVERGRIRPAFRWPAMRVRRRSVDPIVAAPLNRPPCLFVACLGSRLESVLVRPVEHAIHADEGPWARASPR